MKKLSAYQKLKLRVAELEHDLNEVVLNPDSFDAQIIKSDITFIHEMDKQLFIGERANYAAKGLIHWTNVSEDMRDAYDGSKFSWCSCDEEMLSKTIGNPHIAGITLKPQTNITETEKP